jgi:aspartate beta-hydroxylase
MMRNLGLLGDLRQLLTQAHELELDGQVVKAEAIYFSVLARWPANVEASTRLAHFALERGSPERAAQLLEKALKSNPTDAQLAVDFAVALTHSGKLKNAIESLETTVVAVPDSCLAWLLLGQLKDAAGDAKGALKAFFQAVTRAQRDGVWKDEASTPTTLLSAVIQAIERVRLGRRELFFGAFESLRQQYGNRELERVDRALTGYLREWDATPTDPRQRPKFFFFPGLPNAPFHDPNLLPWASKLRRAFPYIRDEAVRVLEEDRELPNFIPDSLRVEDFVSGQAELPSWEAFFFFRHGKRFEHNHMRCPVTSKTLQEIELCRISGQAPEILFSVLRPGSHINPHHGVTNVRLVVHLPLIVPSDCALNLVDRGEHRWKEGELVMFDDTYLHEAWNRSTSTRVVLLMDCWNPHLTEVEKFAVKEIIETMSSLHEADRAPLHKMK